MQVTEVRKFITENKGKVIHIISDNMLHFWANSTDSFIGWNDAEEMCVCIRPADTSQGTTSAKAIWETVIFSYNEIQYLVATMKTEDALKMVDLYTEAFNNSGMDLDTTAKVKEAILKSSNNAVYSATGNNNHKGREDDFYSAGIDSISAKML